MFKRYAGNHTILFYIFLSFIPAITEATKGAYHYFKRLIEEALYVSVIVSDNELIYPSIDEYMKKNFKGIHDIRHVRGKTGYTDPNMHLYEGNRKSSGLQYTLVIELVPGNVVECGLCPNECTD